MRGLNGKAGVIAGGGRGIGAATATRLAEEGAAVVIGDIQGEWAEATAQRIRDAGGKATGFALDICDPASVQAMVKTCLDTYGRLDYFHANAAGGTQGDIDALTIDLAVFDRSIELNLKSYLICTQAAVPVMLEQGGGAMLYTSSGAAYGGAPWQVAYPVAKNGVHALMRHVAARYGKQGIRANVVCPGLVLTEAAREHLNDEYMEAGLKRAASPRLGKPEDLAAMSAFLMSDDAEWITGQVISVNGGMAMRD
ncbi:NAD(P)-dependent dehydrogenase, short-chain alcohol dehydrogenase family [Sphingomonas laterariae]|uniref:NAD(P)-dependent dehydrogenase, short-chain alcohol dehydrogenase family n=1 Tax=Edaphosphingomonas laterariae TaxID=861865 RepID=A0A239GYR1_9SPHN|nr:SDR family oxidoreductase [Sphingomonas laterariae]SNS73693.1 NAD(P)-dependent dehydrogenase, short-chain alcohol dehydrogenase family [Sphingomonas laterariae]